MKDSKPFFYRIVAADFLAEVVKIPDGQHRDWVYQLALDLVAGDGSTSYSRKVIAEVQDYRKQQAKNADKRWKDKKKREERVALRAITEPNGSHMGGNGNNRSSSSTEAVTETEVLKPKTSSSSVDDVFIEFWKIYPRKIGKGDAEKAWKKIKEPKSVLLLIKDALRWQVASENWTKNNGEYIPHPSTYLNQRRWEDEQQTLNLGKAPAEIKKDLPGFCPKCGCGSFQKDGYRECKGCGHKFQEVANYGNPCSIT